jgi:hypothetical protein
MGKDIVAETSKNGTDTDNTYQAKHPLYCAGDYVWGAPVDLFIQSCAQNAAIRVKPDTSWQPPAKDKARVAHGRHLQHQFPAGLWQADTNKITHENVWENNYTVQIPTKEIDMLPSGDIDAYIDGSFVGGKSGAGAFILENQKEEEGISVP